MSQETMEEAGRDSKEGTQENLRRSRLERNSLIGNGMWLNYWIELIGNVLGEFEVCFVQLLRTIVPEC